MTEQEKIAKRKQDLRAAHDRWIKNHPGKEKEEARRRYLLNREAMLKKNKLYYEKNKERLSASARARHHANPELAKVKRLKTVYGLTTDMIEVMKVAQDNVCAICKKPPKKWCVDHDHDTGRIRGLLCYACNTGIGHLGDDTDRLQAAINYLSQGDIPL